MKYYEKTYNMQFSSLKQFNIWKKMYFVPERYNELKLYKIKLVKVK